MFFKKRNKYTITCLRCLVFMCCFAPFWFLKKFGCYQPVICAFNCQGLPILRYANMNASKKWEQSLASICLPLRQTVVTTLWAPKWTHHSVSVGTGKIRCIWKESWVKQITSPYASSQYAFMSEVSLGKPIFLNFVSDEGKKPSEIRIS